MPCLGHGDVTGNQGEGSKQPERRASLCLTAPGKAPLFLNKIFLATNKQLMCPASRGHASCCLLGNDTPEELFLEKAAQHERQDQI